MSDRTEQLKAIRDEILNLTESPLYSYRVQNGYYPVIGQGSHHARIMFIGEAPGENEAKTGRPFCGASGRFLDEMLASIALKREDVYITNIVKDRPPENRDPSREEIALYAPFLERQLQIIQPQVIATLGRYSMKYILDKYGAAERNDPISKLHGRVLQVMADWGALSIVALFHPASALYNPTQRQVHLEDFKVLTQFM